MEDELLQKRSPDKNQMLDMINGIPRVKYSVRNSLDKLERFQLYHISQSTFVQNKEDRNTVKDILFMGHVEKIRTYLPRKHKDQRNKRKEKIKHLQNTPEMVDLGRVSKRSCSHEVRLGGLKHANSPINPLISLRTVGHTALI